MPRIQDRVLDAVIYLYDSKEEALAGENIGGSGFLLGVMPTLLPPPASFIYAVTNAHVVEQGATCVRLNTLAGDIDVFAFKKSHWQISEEDDLAIICMPDIADVFKIHAPSIECLVTKQFVKDHDVGIGDDVMMVGRFINRDGIQSNTPSARFGNIAQNPGKDPILIERRGNTFAQEEAFLAEIRSISGFSGSPVYVLPNPTYGRNGKPLPTDRAIILGIDFCHLANPVAADKPHDHVMFSEHTGMAGVVPGWKLEAFVNSDKNKASRKASEERERQRRLNSRIAKTDAAAPPASGENPTHREDFMRLVDAAGRKPEPKD